MKPKFIGKYLKVYTNVTFYYCSIWIHMISIFFFAFCSIATHLVLTEFHLQARMTPHLHEIILIVRVRWISKLYTCNLILFYFSISIYLISTFLLQHLQYRHLIIAPVDRASASAWLYKHPYIISIDTSQAHQLPS